MNPVFTGTDAAAPPNVNAVKRVSEASKVFPSASTSAPPICQTPQNPRGMCGCAGVV